MKEKKKLLQKHEFCTKGKVHIMGKFLFWTFRRWEIRSSFDSKSWCKMIFSSAWNTMFFEYGKVLVLNFSEIGNTVFFYLKSWWKVDIFLVFFNFSWYPRTWEIWFFVQCKLAWSVFCFRSVSTDFAKDETNEN